MNAEILLSDKFVEFSQKISALHETKKKLSTELKKVVEEHKIKLKEIDQEALALQNEFDSWMRIQQPKQQA